MFKDNKNNKNHTKLPIKIAIDARFYGLENAGLGRYPMNLIENLAHLDSKNNYFILLRKKYYQSLSLPRNFKKVLADLPHYGIAEQKLLPKILADINPTITHFLHFNIPVFYKQPFIVTIHDLIMHKQKRSDASTLPPIAYHFKKQAYLYVFNQAVKKSKKIIVPTKVVKNDLLNSYKVNPDKVDVIYEGVSISSGSNDKNIFTKYGIGSPYFIYVGNAYPHKNLNRAIDATLSLNKSLGEKIQLVICTSRNFFYEKLSKNLTEEQKKYIILINFINDDDLVFLFKNSLGFLYPSLIEGFGLPGLEAMAAGTVTLASDIPVFKEVYKDNAFYFNPYDFSSIEKSMEEVYKLDMKKRELHVKKAKEFIKNYSWRKTAEYTLKIYEECSNSLR